LIDKWKSRRASYEAVIPGTDRQKLFEILRRDLNLYSPFTAVIEKRKMACLVLVDKDSLHQEKSNSLARSIKSSTSGLFHLYSRQGFYLYLKDSNVDISTPIINETRGDKKEFIDVDISLKGVSDAAKFKEVRSVLHKYDLDLIKENREIDILVIKDRL
jgi:hypothetical protein